MYTFDIV